MKVREIVEKLNDIDSTRKLLLEAMDNEKENEVTILYGLADDIVHKLDDLEELWGLRELK